MVLIEDPSLPTSVWHPGRQVTARGDLVGGPGHLVQRFQSAADEPLAANCEQRDEGRSGYELGDDEAAHLRAAAGHRISDEQDRGAGPRAPRFDLKLRSHLQRLAACPWQYLAPIGHEQCGCRARTTLLGDRRGLRDTWALEPLADGAGKLVRLRALG
jgi:hypothetical protein